MTKEAEWREAECTCNVCQDSSGACERCGVVLGTSEMFYCDGSGYHLCERCYESKESE